MKRIISRALSIAPVLAILTSADAAQSDDDNGIDFILVHPPFSESYSCSEHWDGQLPYLGDSLGTDCTIGRLIEDDGRRWMREYQNDGLENDDWFGYGADVLAPCDCAVAKIQVNREENKPGVLGEPPASSITFERADGALILLAHIKDIQVAEGDEVSAGDIVAAVGNNGYSRQPHVHIGAWRDNAALQIRFDQKSMKAAIDSRDTRMRQAIASVGYVWGYLKYHHPYLYEDCASWDGELVDVLKEIDATDGKLSIDTYLDDWLQRTQAEREAELVESLARQQSTGIAIAQRPPKTDSFGIDLQPTMDAVRRDFVPEGQKCAYLGENTAGNALFDMEEAYDDMSPPDEFYRLLALMRFWNMVEYWFPYRELIDEDWDTVLLDSVGDFRAADSSLAYRTALLRLIVRIDDGHASLWTAGDALPPGGWAMSPFAIRSVEGRAFVWKQLDTKNETGDLGIQPGDVVLAVDGKPVSELMEEWRPRYGASNDSSFIRDAYQNMLRSDVEKLAVTVERGGEVLDVISSLVAMRDVDRTPTWTHDRQGETFQIINDDIAYLKLSTLEKEDLPGYVDEMIGKRGLIIDIRGYPNTFAVFSLGQHLVADATPFAKFTMPDANQPGLFHWSHTLEIKPEAPRFEGPVAILVDERSVSQSEYTAMAFRASPNAAVFGSQTAGADGNVSRIVLPGDQKTAFSGLGVFYPDGSPTQQVGILPDCAVHPTMDGLQNGKDEVLEAAIRFIARDESALWCEVAPD